MEKIIKPIIEYHKNGKIKYKKFKSGEQYWYNIKGKIIKYDCGCGCCLTIYKYNKNIIHAIYKSGHETWTKQNKNGLQTYYKNNIGYEYCSKNDYRDIYPDEIKNYD